ncbi:MAG: hypothetical protein FJ285_06465 [Planctomycetes bacterium]|nr:hypothetical protein [Planctomycetota bacterium]
MRECSVDATRIRCGAERHGEHTACARSPWRAMSARIWITADTHFTHTEAIGLFARPVAAGDVKGMDDLLIERINDRVAARDRLIHLGDFLGPRDWKGEGRKQTEADAHALRERICCKHIELVRGNHDPGPKRLRGLFEDVHQMLSIKGWSGGTERIVCCHYPLRTWQGIFHGAFHLYGHAHGAMPQQGRSCDAGVDCWDYGPVLLDEIIGGLAQVAQPALARIAARAQPMRAPRSGLVERR